IDRQFFVLTNDFRQLFDQLRHVIDQGRAREFLCVRQRHDSVSPLIDDLRRVFRDQRRNSADGDEFHTFPLMLGSLLYHSTKGNCAPGSSTASTFDASNCPPCTPKDATIYGKEDG